MCLCVTHEIKRYGGRKKRRLAEERHGRRARQSVLSEIAVIIHLSVYLPQHIPAHPTQNRHLGNPVKHNMTINTLNTPDIPALFSWNIQFSDSWKLWFGLSKTLSTKINTKYFFRTAAVKCPLKWFFLKVIDNIFTQVGCMEINTSDWVSSTFPSGLRAKPFCWWGNYAAMQCWEFISQINGMVWNSFHGIFFSGAGFPDVE